MRRPSESFDYEFAGEPPLLQGKRRDGGQQLGLSPGTLNLINAHVGDARLAESERYSGLRRNVYHSATDELSPANDRDHHATAVVEVDYPDLRPHCQAAMRRNQSSETRILKIYASPCSAAEAEPVNPQSAAHEKTTFRIRPALSTSASAPCPMLEYVETACVIQHG